MIGFAATRFRLQENVNEPDTDDLPNPYPLLEYSLVNKTLAPARVMSLTHETDVRRRTLTEVLFKAYPDAILSPELLAHVQALEQNKGQDRCHHAPSFHWRL